jgi:hypothetical protein
MAVYIKATQHMGKGASSCVAAAPTKHAGAGAFVHMLGDFSMRGLFKNYPD